MSKEREITLVLMPSGSRSPKKLEKRVRLPIDAGMEDLLRELERTPDLHEQVRDRVVRASLDVLANGEGRGSALLRSFDKQLATGGPVIFPPLNRDQDRDRNRKPTHN